MYSELDSKTCPLPGRSLIEASAGAGKTYTLTRLYLRLLIEGEGLSVRNILAVTFTNAAAEDLRERLRVSLTDALHVLRGETIPEERRDANLMEILTGAGSPERTEGRLRAAIADFDDAAIFTIHGFCARALQEWAFESGAPTGAGLLADESELIHDAALDFWRRRFAPASADSHRALRSLRFGPEDLVTLLNAVLQRPGLALGGAAYPDERVSPANQTSDASSAAPPDFSGGAARVRLETAFHKLASYLATMPAEAAGDLQDEAHALKRFTARGHLDWSAPAEAFSIAALRSRKAKTADPGLIAATREYRDAWLSAHSGACDALAAELRRFLQEAPEQLADAKRRRQLLSYQDLLATVRRALDSEEFRTCLKRRFRAGLIDEFQDTDPVQWEIFQRIFSDANQSLFLIGDPKQSIYRFRGAEIRAYLKARRETDRGWTLSQSYRSTERIARGINAIFTSATGAAPFLSSEIEYPPMRSARGPGSGATAVEIAYAPAPEARGWSVEGLSDLAVRFTAARIARQLSQSDNPRPSSIAALVRTHAEADAMRKGLSALGVRSALRSDRSVFESPEAFELETILQAVDSGGDRRWLKRALATALWGATALRITEIFQSPADLERIALQIQELARLWRRRGFMAMFQRLITEEFEHGVDLRTALLRRVGGDRSLTNLLHIAELIHAAANSGPDADIRWLRRQRRNGASRDDASQLRLESDEDAVQIMTVHVSKGLEFETVYCPFLWRSRAVRPDQTLAYHDGDREVLLPAVFARLLASRDRPAPDEFTAAGLTPADVEKARALATRENLEEDLRLFYVAVTRAANKLVIFTGRTGSRSAASAADHALFRLHAGPQAPDDDETRLKTLQELASRAGPDALCVETVDHALEGQPVIQSDSAIELAERKLPAGARARPGFAIKSFTAYARAALEAGADTADFDGARDFDQSARYAATPSDAVHDPWSIFNFPRGAEPGIFLHGLFEELFRPPANLYRARPEDREDLITSELLRAGYDLRWQPAVAGMVEAVLKAPLPGGRSLTQIEPGAALPELAFYYPMPREPGILSVASIGADRRLSRPDGPNGRPSSLAASAPAGFMMGFIDLVFALGPLGGNSSDKSQPDPVRYYLLDWKSNYLGSERRNYDGPSLRRSMREARYPLQYYVYADALDRYLAQRVRGYSYDRHFGGVIYAFLRGVGEQDGRRYGLFCARPAARRLADFRAQYGGGRAE